MYSLSHDLISTLVTYKYLIIIPITVIEGPVIMLVCGFLIRIGALDLLPAYISLMVGDLSGDIIWYAVGYFGGDRFVERFGKFFSVTKEGVETVKNVFRHYDMGILIVSKITMGFGFALVTLITAGLAKIPFGRYITLNAIGELFWTGLLIAIGYFLGNFYITVNSVLGKLFIIAVFVITFFALVGFGKYVKNRTLEKHSS